MTHATPYRMPGASWLGKPRRYDRRREIHDALDDLGSVVYFLDAHGLVKIGCTSDLRNRVLCFGRDLTDLLAVMPGDFGVEAQMHERFAGSLARGREWFHRTPDLLAFINELRRPAALPPIT